MKKRFAFITLLASAWLAAVAIPVPEDITVVSHGEEVADGLDLQAVVQVLKDVKDAEALEQSLNDPELGINNLDLNEDGQVDYIRVVTEQEEDAHVIILQVPLEENEVQDIATIEVEKDEKGEVVMQVHGHVDVYGPDYYVRPVDVHISVFPFVSWLYSPLYRPWRPHFYIGFYPKWYRPWRVVPVSVYRPRITGFGTVRVGVFTKSVVVRAPRLYRPRTTVIVKKPMRRNVTVSKTTKVTVKSNSKTVTKQTKVSKTKGGKTKVVTKKTTTKEKTKKKKN